MVAPVANPLNLSGDEDTEILATLDGTDGDLDPLDYEIVDGPANGIVKLVDDGGVEEYVYIPNADFNGVDSFTYRVFDGTEYSNTATVDVTVNAISDMARLNQGLAPTPAAATGTYEGDQVAVAASANSGWFEVRHGYGQLGDTEGIYLEVFSTEGTSMNNVRVNTTTTDAQYDPAVARLVDGSYVVTWTSMNQDGSGAGVYMQRMTPAGGTAGSETLVNTTTTGEQSNSDVIGLADGGWIVTWEDFDGLETHIFSQRYDDSGVALGGETQVDSAVGYDALDSSVAKLANGGYVIAWETPGGLDGSDQGVFAQRYDAAGNTLGGVIAVNSVTADSQSDPQVAGLPGGGFVVAFGTGPLGLHTGISVRLFNEFGAAIGNDIALDVGGQNVMNLSLATLGDGGFAVAWEAETSSFASAWVQRFDFAGIAVGQPVQVNAPSAEQQLGPVAFFTNGNLNVAFVESIDLVGDFAQHQAFALPAKNSALTEGSPGNGLLPQFMIQDPDTATLESVTVQVKGGVFRPGDTLDVDTGATGIGKSYIAGTLTLSGTAALADYQAVLRTLTMTAPDGGGGTRILDIIAYTADGSSNLEQLHLTVATTNQNKSGDTAADAVYGGNGNDTLNGDDGADTITGNAGDDLLAGGYGADSLVGGMGNDTLNGGYGTDTMEGGEGSDTYYVNLSGDLVIESGESGADVVYAGASFTMSSGIDILYLTGTAGIDGIGNASSNSLFGNSGSNLLAGGSGFDSLVGYGGDDTLDGGFGLDDTLLGCAGNDWYITDGNDTIFEVAGAGIDTIQTEASWTLGAYFENLVFTGEGLFQGIGNGVANHMTGNSSGNKFEGRGGDDTLLGNGGDDTLDGGAGSDSLLGGAGNDLYIIDSAADTADETGGNGVDTVRTLVNFTLGAGIENLVMRGLGNLNVAGNALANNLSGNASSNTLNGSDGNDTLFGGGGNDAVDGGLHNDRLYGGDGDDTVYGGDGNDRLWGGNGSDELWGANGNDTLSGDAGANTLRGGAGDDLYKLLNTGDSVIEFAAEGIDTIEVYDTDYTLTAAEVENLRVIGGTESSLTVTGSAGNNVITVIEGDPWSSFTIVGGGGADTIFGSDAMDDITADGNDFVDAGAEADVVNGTGDDNTIDGGDGDDVIVADGGLSGAYYGGNDDDTLSSINYAEVTLYGDAGNDTLIVDDLDPYSTLVGGTGDDLYIIEHAGNFYGTLQENDLEGFDTVQVTDGNFTLDAYFENLVGHSNLASGLVLTGSIDDNVITAITDSGSANFTLFGGDGNDTLNGAGYDDVLNGGVLSDVLYGNNGNDSLFGDEDSDFLEGWNGNDSLVGGTEADTLIGGDGNDTLLGGAGADVFVFDWTLNDITNVDDVDFESGIDLFELDNVVFSSLSIGGLPGSQFVIGAAAADADDYIVFDDSTGALYYDEDGDGAGAQVKFAQLTGTWSLTNTDFSV